MERGPKSLPGRQRPEDEGLPKLTVARAGGDVL